MIWNLRVHVGRWLLWPLTRSVIYHYAEAAAIQGRKGNKREAEHCRYILIGVDYIGSKHCSSRRMDKPKEAE